MILRESKQLQIQMSDSSRIVPGAWYHTTGVLISEHREVELGWAAVVVQRPTAISSRMPPLAASANNACLSGDRREYMKPCCVCCAAQATRMARPAHSPTKPHEANAHNVLPTIIHALQPTSTTIEFHISSFFL